MLSRVRNALRKPSGRIAPASALETTLDSVSCVEQDVPRIVRDGTDEVGEPVSSSCGPCAALFRRKPRVVVPKPVKNKNPLASLFRRKSKAPISSILNRSCSVKTSRAQTDLLHQIPDRDPEEDECTVGAEAMDVETEPRAGPSEEEDVKDEETDHEEVIHEPLIDASSGSAMDEDEESLAVSCTEDETALMDDAMYLDERIQEPLMATSSDEKDVMSVEDDKASVTDSIETIQLEDGVPAIEAEADLTEDPIQRPSSPRIAWASNDDLRFIKPREKAKMRPTKMEPVHTKRQQAREIFENLRFSCLFPFLSHFHFKVKR